MTFMNLASGTTLSLDCPRPEQFPIIGIAWGLSQINRFHGQAQRPYSVAEHSLLVAEIVERECTTDVHARLAALMHDAHEFVTQDLATPAKQQIGTPWASFELYWERQVRSAYALHTASAAWKAVIKHADLRALATERRDLLICPQNEQWPVLIGIEPVEWVNLMSPERLEHDWEFWRDRFLDEYHTLDFGRNERMAGIGQATAQNGL